LRRAAAGFAIAFDAGRRVRLALLALFLGASSAWAEHYSGMVTRVRDGDTVQVTTDRGQKVEVRLPAIDAPEKARDGRRAQRFASRSSATLTRIAMHRRVTVESSQIDRYGRRVGVLWVHTDQGELDAGLLQVQLGMARIVPRYLPSLPAALRGGYSDAEATAQAKRRGIRSVSRPTREAARAPGG
jgi:endonuclease YncB( thermonuclease family)